MSPASSGDRPNRPFRSGAAQENYWPRAQCLGHCLTQERTEPLRQLARGPMSVGELAAALELDIKAVSKQLRHLRDAGLVECEHHGPERIYRLSSRVNFRRDGDWIVLTMTVADIITLTVDLVDRNTDLTPRRGLQRDSRAPGHAEEKHDDNATVRPVGGKELQPSPIESEIKVRGAARAPKASGS
jgi:DNA-binding transcriptional ArsR family regulator